MINVLFVCLGNICRSPLGEGIFRHLVETRGLADKIQIDSAGTGSWHVGQPPNHNSVRVARSRGIDITAQRARQMTAADLETFDYILAMDSSNLANILALDTTGRHRHKVRLMLSYHPDTEFEDVPDPYFGEMDGFELVHELLEASCEALLDEIVETHRLSARG